MLNIEIYTNDFSRIAEQLKGCYAKLLSRELLQKLVGGGFSFNTVFVMGCNHSYRCV